MKSFISAEDVTNIPALIQSALDFKSDPFKSKALGVKKRVGLLFLNPSMRTRLSSQVAAANLGMESIVFNVGQEGWTLEFEEEVVMNGTSVEHVKDAAPVLGKYFDILGIRTFPSLVNREEDYSDFYIRQIIKYSGIPVISLESATLHPLQSLTDLVTIRETFQQKRRPTVVMTWAPHVKALPQCVANSFSQWVMAWGEADFIITHPKGYELKDSFVKGVTVLNDQDMALNGADYVYVKNWSAFNDYGKVLSHDPDWMLTNKKLQLTNNAKVMHCLPVRRNIELSSEILDGPNSLVTQQAGNRVWAAQAVMADILNTN